MNALIASMFYHGHLMRLKRVNKVRLKTMFFRRYYGRFLIGTRIRVNVFLGSDFRVNGRHFLFPLGIRIRSKRDGLRRFQAIRREFNGMDSNAVDVATTLMIRLRIKGGVRRVFPLLQYLLCPTARFNLRNALLIRRVRFLSNTIRSCTILPVVKAFIMFKDMLSTSTIATVRFALPSNLLRAASVCLDLINNNRRLFSTGEKGVTFHATQVTRHRARKALAVAIRECQDRMFKVMKGVIKEVINEAIIFTNVSARCNRITHVTQPCPIIDIPTRLTR